MKVCIIGTGAICGVHIDALKAHGEEITALCDVDTAKAEAVRGKYGLKCPVYDDYKRMLTETRPDAVHICTPHWIHAEMAVFALQNGVHVLSEKPVCIDIGQLRTLVRAEKSSDAQYGICFQNRYLDANEEALKIVSSAHVYGAEGAVLWNRDAKYYASGAWRGKWNTEGGGVLNNQSKHTLDLMVNALGEPISVDARMSNRHLKGVIEVEDTAELLLRYPEFTAKFTATTAADGSFPVFTAYYTNIGIVETRGDVLTLSGEETPSSKNARLSGKNEWGAGHALLIADFYDKLTAGEKINCALDGCLSTMKTVFAAYRSAERGEEVLMEEMKI